jgi:hypothetical protein
MAVAAVLSLGLALALALAETDVAGSAPAIALIATTAYLGLASAALLPLLLNRRLIEALAAGTVRS